MSLISHAHKNTVMEVKWNLNGNWLLTASRDHLCKLFDIRNLKEELQVFRGHKKEATGEGGARLTCMLTSGPAPILTLLSVFSAVAWHPVHEGLFASGGSDGSLLFWHAGYDETSVGHAHSLLPFLIHSLSSCSRQTG